jgi:hypothetical protein
MPWRLPKGALGALVIIVCAELLVGHYRVWFVDEATAMWEEKARIVAEEPLDTDILAFGSSRLMHGLIPQYLDQQIDPRCITYNLALSGMHPQGVLVLLERSLARRQRLPRVVLIEFSPSHFGYPIEQTYGSPYLRSLYNAGDIIRAMRWDLDATVALEWTIHRVLPSARYRQGLNNFISRAIADWRLPTRYRDRNLSIGQEFAAGLGYRPWREDALPNDYHADNPPDRDSFSINPAMADALECILRLCKKYNIRCVLVPAPLPDSYVQAARATGYEDAWLAWLCRLTDRYPLTTIAPATGLPNRFFCDATHLNSTGARLFSIEIGGWLAQRQKDLGLDAPFGNGLLIEANRYSLR